MSSDDADWIRQRGSGKYVRTECERRFLLAEVPPSAAAPRLIEDRYLQGTGLRLRRVEQGSRTVYKFCQKVRPDEGDPSTVAITNMYLSEVEYAQLSLLPAATLRKTRRRWVFDGDTFAVDEFHDGLAGLLLAEVELPDLRPVRVRHPLGAEVTHDDRYSGGRLATAGPEQRAELLARIGPAS